MKKALLFVLANVLFAAIVTAIYAFGYEYDKANKLYPESKRISYDVSMQVYGERWVRFFEVMLAIGLIADGAALIYWFRKSRDGVNASVLDGDMR